MKYSKNFRFQIGFDKAGTEAHLGKWGKNYRLGFHLIKFEMEKIYLFRICFLRTKKALHYWQIGFPYGKQLGQSCGN